MSLKLKDKNGTEINIGDKLKLEIEVQVGSRWVGRGRNRCSFPIKEKKIIIFDVEYGLFKTTFTGEIITWYLTTDEKESYNSTFWSGCGRTQSEKRANESRPVTFSLDRVLSSSLAQSSEILGKESQ